MSGVNEGSRLDGYVKKMKAAGIPATVVDPSAIGFHVDPKESAESLGKLLKHHEDPEGVPVHHTTLEIQGGDPEFTTPSGLDPDFSWFFLGLPYGFIRNLYNGNPRRLFDVFLSAGKLEVPIKSHRGMKPIAEIKGTPLFERFEISHQILGIPHAYSSKFRDFVASYRFKTDPGASDDIYVPGETVWRLDWVTIKIADPFIQPNTAVDVHFALPLNLRTSRGVVLVTPPNLGLSAPVFGATHVSDAETKQYAV
jgi:hypothetical protein